MTVASHTPDRPLRIGTRGSPLALAQTAELRRRLAAAHPHLAPAGAIETVVIKTTGDRVQDRRLMEIGGKGLFTKEIENALLAGRIDCAIHSLKDMQTWLPAGARIGCILPREDPRDVLIAADANHVADLPKGAVIGTASLRRQAQLLAQRPDLKIVPMRGNVETRLKKLAGGEADATLLALAGLRRLGLVSNSAAILSPEEMLPAVGQGALAIETRDQDERMQGLLRPLNHGDSAVCVLAERACLAELDGSCHTPIAALAELVDDGREIRLRALIALPDGSSLHREDRRGPVHDPRGLGIAAARALKARADPAFFRSMTA
ncbi:MAG: hydroxymethylbilane synthase [Dongiaceae bacterium]